MFYILLFLFCTKSPKSGEYLALTSDQTGHVQVLSSLLWPVATRVVSTA